MKTVLSTFVSALVGLSLFVASTTVAQDLMAARADDWLAPWPQPIAEQAPARHDERRLAGPLRSKAEAFQWWQQYSVPFHGAIIERTHFDGPLSAQLPVPEVVSYSDWDDSCEWTGLYLGSQAMRYQVTGSADARDQVMRTVNALSRNLHVTGKRGFIARYSAPQDALVYPGDEWCDSPSQDRCHRVEEGEFAGEWWRGETSRDMYGGWFFGMALAYDLVDDEPMRERIRADVTEVLEELIRHDWLIIDEGDEPTTAAPNILPPFKLSWLLIGYHLTGNAVFADELRPLLLNEARLGFRLSTISAPNRYTAYYGNALSHELWYNLLRLAKVYLDADDSRFFHQVFEQQVHSFTRLSHNPFFNGVFMGQGAYEPAPGDPYFAQLVEDLTLFPAAPRTPYFLPARPENSYELDPVSVFLVDLAETYPVLVDLILPGVSLQALEAFPMHQQCERKLFERSPFTIGACGDDDPARLGSGTDFLLSYWMASYHGWLSKAQ